MCTFVFRTRVSGDLCAQLESVACVALWEWLRRGGGLVDSFAPLVDGGEATWLQVGLLSRREAFHEMHVSLIG